MDLIYHHHHHHHVVQRARISQTISIVHRIQLPRALNTTTASLQKGKTTPYEYPGYDTKQSDGEALVILKLKGMWSTSLVLSHPGPIRPGVVAPDKVRALSQIELNCFGQDGTVFAFVLRMYAKLNCLR